MTESAAKDADRIDEASAETALQLILAIYRLTRSLRRGDTVTSLHPTQVLVLSALIENGPMRIGEVAVRVPCSQPTATTVVNGLSSAGLVRRVPDKADGRATTVELTEEGSATLVSLARERAVLLDERMAELSEQDRQLVRDVVPVLQRMAHLLPG